MPGVDEDRPWIQRPSRTRAIPRRTLAGRRGERARRSSRLTSAERRASSIRSLAITSTAFSWIYTGVIAQAASLSSWGHLSAGGLIRALVSSRTAS